MFATIAAILAPIAGKLIAAYFGPKLSPVIKEVKLIEKKYDNLPDSLKHDKILRFIEKTPALSKFTHKCGWNMAQINTVIKFCVLMAKKPITDHSGGSRRKWDEDDLLTVFDFLQVIAIKWIKAFKEKR